MKIYSGHRNSVAASYDTVNMRKDLCHSWRGPTLKNLRRVDRREARQEILEQLEDVTVLVKYVYHENNSGGFFTTANKEVVIYAEDEAEADALVQAQGVYFGGVARNIDCECCGDRWYPKNVYL